MRSTRRLWLWIAVPLLSAILWLPVAVPWWASRVLAHELAEQNIHLQRIEWERIGYLDTRIRLLEIHQASTGISLRAHGLLLRYTPSSLWRGALSRWHVDIDELRLRLPPSSKATGITLLSPLAVFSWSPLASLRIDAFRVLRSDHPTRTWRGRMHLTQNRLRLQAKAGSHGQAWLDVRRNGQWQGTLTLDSKHILRLQGELREKQNQWSLRANVSGDIDTQGDGFVDWPVSGKMSTNLFARFPTGHFDHWQTLASHMELHIDARFEGKAQVRDIRLSGKARGEFDMNRGKAHWRIDPESEIRIRSNARVVSLHPSLEGEVRWQRNGTHTVSIARASRLHLSSIHWPGVSYGPVSIELAHDLRIDPSPLRIGAWEARLSLPAADIGHTRLHPADVRLRGSPWREGGSTDITMEMRPLAIRHPLLHLQGGMLSVRLRTGPAQADEACADFCSDPWRIDMRYAYQPDAHWRMQAGFQPEGNRLHAKGQIILSQPLRQLRELLPNFPSYPDNWRQHGPLRLDLEVQTSPQRGIEAQGGIYLDDWRGRLGNVRFHGLQGEAKWKIDHGQWQWPHIDIRLAELDAGVPLRQWHLSGEARFGANAQLHLRRFRLSLLGGSLQAQEFRLHLHPDEPDDRFLLRLRHIDLQRLTALEGLESLQVSGLLDGELPFHWNGRELSVQDAQLRVRAPGGVIRYRADDDSPSDNPGLRLASSVLRNFHYRTLNARADYRADGQLHMQIHLQGHNPEYDHGRPVNFHIQWEENLRALLKSLMLGNEISERLRRHWSSSPE